VGFVIYCTSSMISTTILHRHEAFFYKGVGSIARWSRRYIYNG
jgi:hypothetical protein